MRVSMRAAPSRIGDDSRPVPFSPTDDSEGTVYDVRRLRLLKELADRGTLAEVAAALNYSPSSVSQQLDLLEREVGLPLLLPAGRGVFSF